MVGGAGDAAMDVSDVSVAACGGLANLKLLSGARPDLRTTRTFLYSLFFTLNYFSFYVLRFYLLLRYPFTFLVFRFYCTQNARTSLQELKSVRQ